MSPALPLGTRLLFFLYGTPNIVGCVLALGGLALFFGGVIRDWWLPIVGGLYAIGWLAAPRRRDFATELGHEAVQGGLLDDVDELIAKSAKRVPVEATQKLRAIRAILDSLMPKLQGLADAGTIAMDQVLTLINAIRRDLPATVTNYVRLPHAYATLHPLEGGKTAKELLLEQLDLLEDQLTRIAHSAFREDAEALRLNGQYLREKFRSTPFLPAR